MLKGRGYCDLNLDFWRKCVCKARMSLMNESLKPPESLALAYAKHDSRAFLELLLRYDVKLGSIIRNGKEPLIGQMRLAWWRESIAKPADMRPSGEPVLAALSNLDGTPLAEQTAQAMLQLTDAWGELLAQEIWTEEVLGRYAKAKASAVFLGFADVTTQGAYDEPAVRDVAEYWATTTLMLYCQNAAQHDAVMARLTAMTPRTRLPSVLRPLTILAFSAMQDQAAHNQSSGLGNVWQGLRLIFNALTGR
jgi:15-cis-phytoene synthase